MIEVEIIAEFDSAEEARKFAEDAEECIGKNNGYLVVVHITDDNIEEGNDD